MTQAIIILYSITFLKHKSLVEAWNLKWRILTNAENIIYNLMTNSLPLDWCIECYIVRRWSIGQRWSNG